MKASGSVQPTGANKQGPGRLKLDATGTRHGALEADGGGDSDIEGGGDGDGNGVGGADGLSGGGTKQETAGVGVHGALPEKQEKSAAMKQLVPDGAHDALRPANAGFGPPPAEKPTPSHAQLGIDR